MESKEQKGRLPALKIGDNCEWNTIINGKITRLKGEIKMVPTDDIEWPYLAEGKNLFSGQSYTEFVYKSQFIKSNENV